MVCRFDTVQIPLNRRQFCLLVLTVSLLLPLNPGPVFAAQVAESTVAVAATVNGTVISTGDFQRELERIQRKKGYGTAPDDEAVAAGMKREALENLIIRELMYQESIRQKIVVEETTVDKELAQAKDKFTTPVQFAENLQRLRMTETMVREQIKRGLAIRSLVDRSVGSGVTVSDEEIRKYYDLNPDLFTQPPRVRLSHILLAADSEWPAYNKTEAGVKLGNLRNRILAGEDFAVLAAAHSDCRSKSKGGDIGWFSPGQLTPEMEKAVSKLEIGGLSEIVTDRFGSHVVTVVARKAAVSSPLEEVKEKIRSQVLQEKGLVMLQRYVKGLRDAAAVEITLTGE
jgi:parvulin-like peptidyl-prolyl isomerase